MPVLLPTTETHVYIMRLPLLARNSEKLMDYNRQAEIFSTEY